MSNHTLNNMTAAQKLSFLAGREHVFGWSRGDRGHKFDVQSSEFAQKAATQLIAVGQRNGLLSRDGNPEETARVQYCLDSRALKGKWAWINPENSAAMTPPAAVSKAPFIQSDPVARQIEMSRRHGSHGFVGDPAKESEDDGADVVALAQSYRLKGFSSTATSSSSDVGSGEPDYREAADVIALARSVRLAGVLPEHVSGKPHSLHARQPDQPDDREAADVIPLARAVGLKGFAKSDSDQSSANSDDDRSASGEPENCDDGSDVIALARAVGLRGFAK